MGNEEYEPAERDDRVRTLFQEGRHSDEFWSRMNPPYVCERTRHTKRQAKYPLPDRWNGGWIRQLNQGGLYEFIVDQKEE